MPNPWKLRQEICDVGRRMYERGLVSAFEGNVSVRIAPDRLLATPSLMCKGLLKPDDLCVVDMTGKQLSGERKRSSEIYLHLGIYRERPEAEAVVHTHAPHATAFALTHTPIPNCITGEVEVFLGEVPLAPYATAGSEQMGEVVAQLLRESQALEKATATASPPAHASKSKPAIQPRPPYAMLLSNHGVVSWGKSLDEALHRTEILEAYCRTLILARSLGPLQRLTDQNMRDLMALKQKLGLPDRRSGAQTFEQCDLSGNNVIGRGFCEPSESRHSEHDRNSEVGESRSPFQTTDVEAIVQEIADRVMRASS